MKCGHYVHELLQVVIYIQSPLTHIFHFVPFILLTLFAHTREKLTLTHAISCHTPLPLEFTH